MDQREAHRPDAARFGHDFGATAPAFGDGDDTQRRSLLDLALKALGMGVIALVIMAAVIAAHGWAVYALAGGALVGIIALIVANWPAVLAADLVKGVRAMDLEVYAAAPAISNRMLRGLPPDRRMPCDLVLDRPQSDYGAALRRFGGRVVDGTEGKAPIIAIAGPRIADGGAMEALSLARTLASQGRSVVAVDCDARMAGLTELVGVKPRRGVWEMLDGRAKLNDVIVGDPRSSVRIIGVADGSNDLRDLFGRPNFEEALHELQDMFDVVILSCPSALNAAVTPVITRNSTLCVIVARWARTSQVTLRAAVRALRLLGVGPRPGVLLTETPSR